MRARARARIRAGRSSAALHVPARYARREPWRSPGVYADECERRRSVARPRERIAGAGDLDPAFARIRALTPPAPGARRSRRGVTCCRRIHPDLSPANTSRPVVGEYIQTCCRRLHPDLLSTNTSRPVVGDYIQTCRRRIHPDLLSANTSRPPCILYITPGLRA